MTKTEDPRLAQYRQLQEEQARDMAALRKYSQDNKLEFFTEPDEEPDPHKTLTIPKQNPPQRLMISAFMDLDYRILCFSGGNRSGNTSTGAILALSVAFGKLLWNKQKLIFPHNKPRKVRVIGQDWEKHVSRVIVPALYEWWPLNRPRKIKKNSLGVEAFWTDLTTGSTIEIMSDRQDTDLHEGWHGDWVWPDEPIKKEIWKANARGLVDRKGRAFFGMTLLKQAWIDRDIIRRVDEKGQPDTTVFSVNATIYDNVGYGITIEGVEQFEKELDEDEKKSRLYGIPAYKQGLVLSDFDRNKHIKERFPIPTDWPVDIAIDVHPRKKQAILFTAVSPRNDRYTCFEIWENGDGTAVGNMIIRLVTRHALRVNRVIIDPLAKGDKNNPNTTFDKVEAVLNRHDYILETATKDKSSGILEMNKGFKGPNNEPSWFVFKDCVRTIHDWEGWMYIEKGDDTGKPSKEEDDFCENGYRTALLGTEYVPPEEDDYGVDADEDTEVCVVTGY